MNQATTIEQRISAAKLFADVYSKEIHSNVKLVVDGIDNPFNAAYSSWPFRVWVLYKGLVEFKGMSTSDGKNQEALDLESWLESHRNEQRSLNNTVL